MPRPGARRATATRAITQTAANAARRPPAGSGIQAPTAAPTNSGTAATDAGTVTVRAYARTMTRLLRPLNEEKPNEGETSAGPAEHHAYRVTADLARGRPRP